MRTLDLTALRALVAVADSGGVTRAANLLNLTQSAVSMQMKRLEQAVGLPLLEKSGRRVVLTSAGDKLLGNARRMLALNDEAITRLTAPAYEGTLTLGVPHDIAFPHIPCVLKRFAAEFPRVEVRLISTYTTDLKDRYDKGTCDLILTTERTEMPGAETLVSLPLVWVGAINGNAWRGRPLPLAFERECIFRPLTTAALDSAGIPWDLVVETEKSRSVAAPVSADLAVHVDLGGQDGKYQQKVDHSGSLPEVGHVSINLYCRTPLPGTRGAPGAEEMAEMIRTSYRAAHPSQARIASHLTQVAS